MDNRNLTIGLVTAGILTGGIAVIIYLAVRHHQKKAEQKKLKNRAIRAIRSVRPKAFPKAERSKIRALSDKYAQKVKEAKNSIDIYKARDAFEEAVDSVRERAQKLRRKHTGIIDIED